MALSEAQKRATEKYNKKAYDKITIRIKKGLKPLIDTRAENEGKSLTKYIVDLIEADLKSGN